MSRLVKVSSVKDVTPQGHRVSFEGADVLLVKDAGAVYAFENVCTHQEKELRGGFAEDGAWVCPHHGARFDLKTGAALSMPAVEGLRTYRVKMAGDDVFLEVEE